MFNVAFTSPVPNVSGFIIVDDPEITCDPIMSSSECEAAAEYLRLSDTSAQASDNQGRLDPPYCYFEGGRLQFNGDGITNTGGCGGGSGQFRDECLCKSPDTTTSTITTTSTTATVSTSGEYLWSLGNEQD